MLLGKRPRPPIKRTTSMTGITVNHDQSGQDQPFDLLQKDTQTEQPVVPGVPDYNTSMIMSVISPCPQQNLRRNSADFLETAHFLRTCGLCNRRLVSGRDIYMYMGDTAFCSLECREKQMKKDERRDCTARKSGDTSSAVPTMISSPTS